MSEIKKGPQAPGPQANYTSRQSDPLQNRRHGGVGSNYGDRKKQTDTSPTEDNTIQKIRDFFSAKPSHIQQFSSPKDQVHVHQGSVDHQLIQQKTKVEEGLAHQGSSTVTDAMRLRFLDALLKTKV